MNTMRLLFGEEKAGLTVPRSIYDGVQNYNGKIFAIGGYDNFAKNTVEKYDPIENTWTALTSLSEKRTGLSTGLLGDQLYVFGGKNLVGSTLSSVEVYDLLTEQWSEGVTMPQALRHTSAITVGGRKFIFLVDVILLIQMFQLFSLLIQFPKCGPQSNPCQLLGMEQKRFFLTRKSGFLEGGITKMR